MKHAMALAWMGTAALGLMAGTEAGGTAEDTEAQAAKKKRAVPSAEVEVVAVATPVMKELVVDRLASPVSVVTSEQIGDLNAQDLPSALRMSPGVIVSRHNPVGSFGGGEGGSVFIRGMGASRPGAEIAMLVDGVPKFVSIWTHPLMDVLSVDNVDQVELYKGAQPVRFGNASFGAVNMVTKSMKEDGFLTSLEVAGGSYGTGVEVLQHGGKQGGFDYYLVQSFRRSDGQREHAGGELKDLFGRVGCRLSEHWAASLVISGTDNWAEDPGPIDRSAPQQGRFATRDTFTVATVSNHYDGAEGQIAIYRDEGRIRWGGQYNSGTKANDVDTNTDYDNFGVRMHETIKPWEGGELLLGADLDFMGGEVEQITPPAPVKRFEESRFRIFAPYAALSHRFGSLDGFHVTPSLGARFMDHSQYGRKAGPQAGFVMGYGATEFHAAYSKGVNFPGLYAKAMDELYMPGSNRWRDLKPETVNHLEAGVSRRFAKIAKLDLTVFSDEGRDRIVVAPPPPFPPRWTNFGTWKIHGVELSATLAPTKNLAIFAGGTCLSRDPQDLPYAPRRSASAGMNYRFLERFQISVDGVYVDGQTVASRGRSTDPVNLDRVGAYAIANAKFAWDFALGRTSRLGQAFLAVENLTDRAYEQKKGYPMPGINGMLGCKLQF